MHKHSIVRKEDGFRKSNKMKRKKTDMYDIMFRSDKLRL